LKELAFLRVLQAEWEVGDIEQAAWLASSQSGHNPTQAWLLDTATFPELCLLSFPLPVYLPQCYGNRLLAGRRQSSLPWELFAKSIFAMLVAEGKAAIAQHLHVKQNVRLALRV